MENKTHLFVLSMIINFSSQIFLVTVRKNKFTTPRLMGYMVFNIFVMSHVYLQGTVVINQGPRFILIYIMMLVSDSFFTLIYITFNHYIFPSGVFGFTIVPKVFLCLALYFQYDDTLSFILKSGFVTTILAFSQGTICEELMLDAHRDEITEFSVLDYYVILYLDLTYIVPKLYYNAK